MKVPIFTLALLVCLVVYIYSGCKPVWQFDNLEHNAKKVITAAELQAWAMDVMAAYPTNSEVRLSELGTNFPAQLRGLAPKLGPFVWFYDSNGTNEPRWVRLHWGSGFLGAHGFEIGPTNFVSRRPGHAWAPGVYFYEK